MRSSDDRNQWSKRARGSWQEVSELGSQFSDNELKRSKLRLRLIDHVHFDSALALTRGRLSPVVLRKSAALLEVLCVLSQVPHIVQLHASDGSVNDGPRDPALNVSVQKPLKLALVELPWEGKHRPATGPIFPPEMQTRDEV